ncbi:beta-galactosidase-1-like protein 2 [Penaeus japonicus]|uniref:beta-galactosidase-1-like protein 2 n=1 Tax=Penaeus japonicus TaxID=27405 RepID=UPI001C70FE8B|nr:beta-galactosidase-1-like protein 2 [Penaeus japonicus]
MSLRGGVYDHLKHARTRILKPGGLKRSGSSFTLNGRSFRIFSGALHYFRVHPEQWPDRLAKLRAAGLNCVETYVPWNLHEPRQGHYDFGDTQDSMSPFLNLPLFLEEARRQDLLVIVRPGPYICAEWDFGGLPSWLLRSPHLQVRTSHPAFLAAASRFLKETLCRIQDLTVSRKGPLIALQVENEYGAFGYGDLPRDSKYLDSIYEVMRSIIPEEEVMYFTSDSPSYTGDLGAIKGVLQTANTQTSVSEEFKELRQLQPNQPLVVMEFWSGWFDHWMEPHRNRWPEKEFSKALQEILMAGASFNFYMFCGGTNFGFLAGANVQKEWPFYAPDVTSYDYDCLLTENGDYTPKYMIAKQLISLHSSHMNLVTPDPPEQTPRIGYGDIVLNKILNLNELIGQLPHIKSPNVMAMEDLDINDGNGQSYGYTLYRTRINVPKEGATITIRGHVRDLALLLVDLKLVSTCIYEPRDLDCFGSWVKRNSTFELSSEYSGTHTLDILVENLGRVNYGKPHDFTVKKGLSEGPVLLGNEELQDWLIYPIEFKSEDVERLLGWRSYANEEIIGPALLQGELEILGEPQDTFLDACGWGKGAVFVNGFNLGRFWSAGPQRTLYVPGPLLKEGLNKVTVWSQYGGKGVVMSKTCHDLGPNNPSSVTPGSGGPLINICKTLQ